MRTMRKEYGSKTGKQVFYASKNAGKISGVDEMAESLNGMGAISAACKINNAPEFTIASSIPEGRRVSFDPAAPTATDEHLGFSKLEHKLAHEKGITNPAAVAAHIGREKYGAAGMAKKSAAGRKK